MVGDDAIPAPDHEIPDVGSQILFEGPLQTVDERDRRIGCPDSQRKRALRPVQSLASAMPRVDGRVSIRRQGFAGTGAGEKQRHRLQLREGLGIAPGVPALERHLPIPQQTEAFQGSQYRVGRRRPGSLRIDVIDAQHPLPALALRLQEAGQRGIEGA